MPPFHVCRCGHTINAHNDMGFCMVNDETVSGPCPCPQYEEAFIRDATPFGIFYYPPRSTRSP